MMGMKVWYEGMMGYDIPGHTCIRGMIARGHSS